MENLLKRWNIKRIRKRTFSGGQEPGIFTSFMFKSNWLTKLHNYFGVLRRMSDKFDPLKPLECLLTDLGKNSRLTRRNFLSYWFGPTRLARLHRDALQIMGGVLIARHKRPRSRIYLRHSNAKELLFVKGSSRISLNTGGCRRMNGEELKGEVSTAISDETDAAAFRSLSPLDWCLAIYQLLRATIHLAQ